MREQQCHLRLPGDGEPFNATGDSVDEPVRQPLLAVVLCAAAKQYLPCVLRPEFKVKLNGRNPFHPRAAAVTRRRHAARPFRCDGGRDCPVADRGARLCRSRHRGGKLVLYRRAVEVTRGFPRGRFRDSFHSHQMWGLRWDHRSKSGKIDRLPSCVGWRGGSATAGLRHGFMRSPTRLTG